MLSSIISRSTAAFGGAPFRLKKCTALTSAAGGAAGGAAAGGVPGALVGGASGFSIWDYWSAKSSKYSPRGMNNKYNSFANIHDIKTVAFVVI